MTSNDKTEYTISLTDKVSESNLTLSCRLGATKPPEGLKKGDKVKAKGTVDESFDKPELKDCTIAKAK